jgi:hypothetical protein
MKREILPGLNAEDKTLMENILAAGKNEPPRSRAPGYP